MFDDINSITISGNVTRDMEVGKSKSGSTSIGKFSVATNRSIKKEDGSYDKKATFFNVMAFGKYAETLARFVKKGVPIIVEGALDINNYEKDGEKKTWISIICKNCKIMKAGSGGGSASASPENLFDGDSAGAEDADVPF